MSGVSFGDLRSLAQREPSRPVWATLCAMIESWPDARERDELASPYVLEQLDRRWPDDLRVLPGRWVYERAGQAPHYLSWGRALHLGRRDLRSIGDGTLRWPDAFPWEGVTRVRVQMGASAIRLLAPLRAGALFEGLDALSFSSLRPGARELLSSLLERGSLERLLELELMTPGVRADVANLALDHPGLPSLRALSFTRMGEHSIQQELDGDALAHRVAASARAGSLTTLGLRFVRLSDAGALALAQARLPALEGLNLEGNRLTQRGLDALLASRWGQRGVDVSVRGCPELDADVDLLALAAFHGSA